MTITLDLQPDIESHLLAQAQAKGVSIHDYVQQIVESQARQSEGAVAEPKSLVRFFRESPLVGLPLDLDRDTDTSRDITL